MEPLFLQPVYADLVPDVRVTIRPDGNEEVTEIPLLTMGHRLADATIRFSDGGDQAREAFDLPGPSPRRVARCAPRTDIARLWRVGQPRHARKGPAPADVDGARLGRRPADPLRPVRPRLRLHQARRARPVVRGGPGREGRPGGCRRDGWQEARHVRLEEVLDGGPRRRPVHGQAGRRARAWPHRAQGHGQRLGPAQPAHGRRGRGVRARPPLLRARPRARVRHPPHGPRLPNGGACSCPTRRPPHPGPSCAATALARPSSLPHAEVLAAARAAAIAFDVGPAQNFTFEAARGRAALEAAPKAKPAKPAAKSRRG